MIEKDWWVTMVLRALFALPYSDQLSIKGGTSLSKCWNLIRRMSEDADICINREFLGFSGELSKTQISDKLRRATCSFVREKMMTDLRDELIKQGLPEDYINVKVTITPITTTDPETIYVEYKPLFHMTEYIIPKVKIEVSGRSMTEPVEKVKVSSYIASLLPVKPFEEKEFILNAVLPHRTFLEKIFLLHEEFSKPDSNIRIERMSRHLYDIHQILKTNIAEEALANKELYEAVKEHRRRFIGLKGFDYDSLSPNRISFVPKGKIKEFWRKDYEHTVQSMILDDVLPFDEMIRELENLNNKIRLQG